MSLDDDYFSGHSPFVELNLASARLEREVEERIKAELARLPSATRKSVLERVVVDVLSAEPALHAKRHNGASTANGLTKPPPTVDGESNQTHWEKIVTYCQAHNPNGKFKTTDVTEALLPDKFKESPAVALSTIYTAVKRRSVGVSSDPHFVWLKKGRFRLATPEERAKAQEAAKAKG